MVDYPITGEKKGLPMSKGALKKEWGLSDVKAPRDNQSGAIEVYKDKKLVVKQSS